MPRSSLKLIWSAEAENDLEAIWRFGAQEWSPAVANDHEHTLWRVCNRILENPKLGKPRDELVPGLHSIVIDPHVVFYRASSNAIEIVRIVHQREEVDNVFG